MVAVVVIDVIVGVFEVVKVVMGGRRRNNRQGRRAVYTGDGGCV